MTTLLALGAVVALGIGCVWEWMLERGNDRRERCNVSKVRRWG